MSIRATDVTNNIEDIRRDDIIIAFIGPVGVGKSFIIDLLTNQKDQRTNHKLKSCMESVQVTRISDHPEFGDRVVLVDTPGFDDTTRTDMQILEIIGNWLTKTYENYVKLSGIVYLHRITDNRMAGSQYRNLRTFRGLVGDDAMKNVILLSTMWEKVQLDIGKRREGQLRDMFWKGMIERGSRIDRLEKNNYDEAWRVLTRLIKESQAQEAILLQKEVVELGKQLNETQAGKNLYTQFQKLLTEQKAFMKILMEQVKKPEMKEKLEREAKRLEEQFRESFNQAEELEVSFGRQIMLLFFGTKKLPPRSPQRKLSVNLP